MIRVGVAGAAGRMGATVCAAVEDTEGMEIAGKADPALGTELAEILDEVMTVQKAVEAEGTFVDPRPTSPAEIFRGVYAEMPPHLRRQRQEMGY